MTEFSNLTFNSTKPFPITIKESEVKLLWNMWLQNDHQKHPYAPDGMSQVHTLPVFNRLAVQLQYCVQLQ